MKMTLDEFEQGIHDLRPVEQLSQLQPKGRCYVKKTLSPETIDRLKNGGPGQIFIADEFPVTTLVPERLAELEKENAELRKKLQALTGGGFWD